MAWKKRRKNYKNIIHRVLFFKFLLKSSELHGKIGRGDFNQFCKFKDSTEPGLRKALDANGRCCEIYPFCLYYNENGIKQ